MIKPLPFAEGLTMFRAMHPDVVKLVESGRIPQTVGERLSQLAPGSFCLHKSWGSGKVADWDLFGGKVTIDFEREPGRVMGLKLALEKTEPLEVEDFRAQKVEKIEELRAQAQSDPAAVVIQTLEAHGGSMKPDQIDRVLCGSVVPEADYKKWWDRAKKALRESHRVVVPSKRNESLVLRDTDLSPVQTLLSDFEVANSLRDKAKILDDLRKQSKALESEGMVEELLAKIEEISRKGIKLHLGDVLDLLAGRDELLEALKEVTLADNALRLHDVLASSSGSLAPEMAGLPAARQRRIYEAFPEAFGDEWLKKILSVFDRVGTRGVAEIAKMFADHDEMDTLLEHIRRALSRHALGPDALAWICRERRKAAQAVFTHEVGSAILSVIEQDSTDEGPRRTLRLQNFLMEDRELVADLLDGVEMNDVRNFARKLLQSPAFAELDRKSLMARVIKAHPEAQELVTGDGGPRRDTLVVSWDSLEKRKEEYEDLVNKRIPGNIKEIAIARSYGDLRENFEYKAAKQMQAVLARRKTELEKDLDNAQGSDLTGADTSSVNIGTVVTLRHNGDTEQYTVLGAWDSDPDQRIVSYLSDIGQALIGQQVGAKVEFRDLETEEERTYEIAEISAWK
ncbi:MAG: GreA/GreB family elongation factor [Roseibacillus sp.]|nr:GreA/GreB family elongation factor [Roseibacillus sp.]